MSFRSHSKPRSSFSSSSRSKVKRRGPLGLEQLEARMLMAFDILEQQIDELGGSVSGLQSTPIVGSAVGRLQVVGDSSPINNGQRILSSVLTVRIQLLRDSNGNLPSITWGITSRDELAQGSVSQSGEIATFTFNRIADYSITVSSGSRNFRFSIRIVPSLTTLAVSAAGTQLSQSPLAVNNRFTSLTVNGLDQLGRNIRSILPVEWSVEQAPQNSSPQFVVSGTRTRINFDRAGSYTFRVSLGTVSSTVRISVLQTLGGIAVSPGTATLGRNESLQFAATARDQFQQLMSTQPNFQWSASGGTISDQGLFQAGNAQGNFRVTVRSGDLLGRVNFTITAGTNNGGGSNTGVSDANLRSLVTTHSADGTISREEMIQILRSVGSDNTVSATELTDLRFIVSPTSTLRMPEFVRTLARNVVNSNPANLRYQGQAAGNLAAGSSASRLNNLVDKWFLGTDLPTITGGGISYRSAVGSLFPQNPSLGDSQQGMLGDCYFLASLVSIGVKNQSAIRNMFIENSDGTVAIRFFANGVADYVTVNRQLPTYANGALAYSGYGRNVSSNSTPLWLALAEKAYAQWNETGKAGRDGSNTYAGIEGGWMGAVNAQVLGYQSTNYAVNASNKQILINALSSNQAVTIGTTPDATAGGLVGSHAYIVTGYNSTADNFSFYNPWSFLHPTALTWNQLQGQTSFFIVTSPQGSASTGTTVRQTSVDVMLTYIETIDVYAMSNAEKSLMIDENTDASLELQAIKANMEFTSTELVVISIVEHITNSAEYSSEELGSDLAGLLADLSLISLYTT